MSSSIRQNALFAAEDYQKVFKAYQYIDYTAYDFDTLKQALINYIQTYYPENFNDYIESSEFLAIIELLAYYGTSLAFRTDLNSRENFIDTAERRESIVRLAQMVNYTPRRNVAASGLFKIASVQTNQQMTDANGVAINDTPIFWNDANNSDWFDQFVQICNAAFNGSNPFGRPSKSGTIGSIPTDLYELNNITQLAITYPISATINNQGYPIDICNPDFITNQTIFERNPDPSNAFNFIYRNDSLGVGSVNTGFFLYFRQGTLSNTDTNFQFPVPNRTFDISTYDINQDDVYVQETDQNGNVVNQWAKVPFLAGENVIYNSIQNSQRNIFDVISGANDTVTIRFADGNFGNVPTGLFRIWTRVSANDSIVIRPDAIQGQQIVIPYIGNDQQQYILRVSFNLEQTIGNAAPSETNDQIRLRAPEVFSSQSRMVNGSDYNVLPLVYGNQIAKLSAINRTFSGQSRYIDMNDPTGFHKDLIVMGDDGALYRDNENVSQLITEDASNTNSINLTITNTMQSLMSSSKVSQFFYDEYLTQFEDTVRINVGANNTGYSLLDLNNPNQTPLFWCTSPTKSKNSTGYFVSTKSATAQPQELVNTFNTNLPGNVKAQAWGLITTGSAIELANSSLMGSTWVYDPTTLNSTPVQSVTQEGLPLIINPLNTYANIGPIVLGTDQPNLYQAIKVYPTFRSTFNSAELTDINTRIDAGTSFWIYYDLLNDTWATSIATVNGSTAPDQLPFVYPAPPSGDSGNEIFSTWGLTPTNGLIYVYISTQNQSGITTYNIVCRGRAYVFESYRDVDFFWQPGQVVIDNSSGLALQDTVEVLPFVNTNNTVDNNNPIITNPATSFLSQGVSFNITGIYTEADGFTDTSKISVSLLDSNNDGIPDMPDGFDNIISYKDRIIFEYYTDPISGYQSTRPWICNWNNTLNSFTGDVYVYFPVDTNDNTLLYGAPFVANMLIEDTHNPSGTSGAVFVYLDQSDLLFINAESQIGFNTTIHAKSIANQITAFFNITIDQTTTAWANVNTYYPWLLGTEYVANKISIINNYFLNKSFMVASDVPGYSEFYSLAVNTTLDLLNYPAGSTFGDIVDTTHYDKNGKSFTQNTAIPLNNQIPFQFKWKHYAPLDQRVDPAPTNIVDMVVITNSYYADMLSWAGSNGTLATLPATPTTEDLRLQFQDLDQYKMISDSIVWNSGSFQLLFGPQAVPELQATFVVIKSPSTNVTDNEISTGVIQAINTYFDIRNWDFGETFYYTELAAYIHQQLSRIISSVVIVPTNADSQFGSLFEITCNSNQLFMSTATVNNVQIVSSYSKQNLNI